ncbi:TetR/AcrR family transcriptional regulator [Planomonospora venezuelensis]|uniref:TetR/AcrR family transcriptional repressor of lmrAB and yxaGH operons n=1 Tax=Planomonospora venezuelensis TaxID=1999 RepID=A0A841D950_PLAVE|nr:TetR/AcrR family transcriptional regulator [Planomonospora venezuelensis]MBB5967152.1 TetR/AcrR family transcriptional repressor of lmrAB and yxaGH operons [Planomonospora venezuelensis]GIN02920.1 TetR family transcriptional regulator [Planomonospora venezuelensis]
MSAPAKHREAIVRAAATLFRQKGYTATGLNEILAASGAPKGSLYHYFPQGKTQIGQEVIRQAGRLVTRTLADLAAHESSPAALLRAYARMVAGWMAESGFRDGSPITTTLLELAPQEPGVTAAGHEAFTAWSAVLEDGLTAASVPPARARRLAGLAIAALEGSLVRARVEQDSRPVIETMDEVADLLDTAMSASGGQAKDAGKG